MAEPARESIPGEGTDLQPTSDERDEPRFHFFPKLPPEVRIKIWKAACLPRTSTDHGIHFITVDRVPETDDRDSKVTSHPNLEGFDEEFYDVENEENGFVTLRAVRRKRPETRKNASAGW